MKNHMKKVWGIALLAGLMAAPMSANAFFEIVEEEAIETSHIQNSNYLTQMGRGVAQTVNGEADKVSVKDSLGILLPSGWKSEIPAGTERKVVSWSGGKPWVLILEDIGQQSETNFIVHWDRKIVISKPAPRSAERAAKTYAAYESSSATESTSASSRATSRKEPQIKSAAEYEQSKARAERALMPAPTKLTGRAIATDDAPAKLAAQWVMPSQWEMKAGSLRQQLNNWVRTAKYAKVDWQVAGDYHLGGGGVFNGNLSHALMQLQEALGSGGIPIIIEEFDNKIILVRERY